MTRSTRVRRLLIGLPLALALSGVAAVPVPVAAQTGCEAKIVSTGNMYPAVATAVSAAPAGATIQVRGTCLGPVIVDKNLTLVGKPSATLGAPGIYGQESVRVLEVVAGKTVTVKDLELAFGYAGVVVTAGTTVTTQGGGVLNMGTLTLTNVVVRQNDAGLGGGIANHGTLRIDGTSKVHHNRSASDGGGIYSPGTTTLAGTAQVYENTAGGFGGGIVGWVVAGNTGRVILREASVVRDNHAPAGGAGIAVNHVPVVLRDTASVRSNETTGNAGGIYLIGATLTMLGRSSIKGNTGGLAGGVYGQVAEGDPSKVTLKGSSVMRANVGEVGAIYLQSGALTMLDKSSVRDHRSLSSTATVAIAVDLLPATFTMKDQSIVTDNRVGPGLAAVLKIDCPSGTPTFVGVKPRVTGNSPKNIITACP